MRRLRGRGWQYARTCIGLALGGGLLWLGLRNLSWRDFSRVLARVRWPWVILAWLTVLCTSATKTCRWKQLLRGNGHEGSWLSILAMLSVGQLVNALLPGRFGELARAHLARRESVSPFMVALGTIVVEKALDGLAALSLMAILALTIVLPQWFRSATVSFAGALVVLAILVSAVTLGQSWLVRKCRRLPERWRGPVEGGLQGIGILCQRGTLLPSAALTLLIWLLGASTNYLLFVALGLPTSTPAALLILVTIHLGSLVPVVPGQLGLFHYLTVLALTVFEVSRQVSMPYATVLYVLVYASIIALGVGGLAWLSTDWHTLTRQLWTLPDRVNERR